MSFRKIVAGVMLGFAIAFSAGISVANAEVQPARISSNIVVEQEGLVTTMRATASGGWEDVVHMYDTPVVIIACRDNDQARCDKAKAVLQDLANSEGGNNWAFVVLTNGLGNTDLAPMVIVGDNPAWTGTFVEEMTVSQLLAHVKNQLNSMSFNKAYQRAHCLPPVYNKCH